jgi:membrane protease YdiL (CAAX protease family)
VGASEIVLVFVVAAVVILVGWRLVGEGALARQAVVWVANVGMLVTIWVGLRARGQGWEHLGLVRGRPGFGAVVAAVWKSVLVLLAALVAFVGGSMVVMPLIEAAPAADLSGYNYLEGNVVLLLVALAGVYVVSSLGEEIVYRGFLLTRLEEMGGGGRWARWVAVVVSSIAFGLAHFAWGPVGIVQTTFMGLALALAFLVVKRNLWILVLAHMYMDTALLVQQYLGQ